MTIPASNSKSAEEHIMAVVTDLTRPRACPTRTDRSTTKPHPRLSDRSKACARRYGWIVRTSWLAVGGQQHRSL